MFLSGIYLFICCVLGFGGAISDANAIGFFSGLWLLTAPWSFWLGNGFYHHLGADGPSVDYLIFAIGALLNALLLYIVSLLISRAMCAVFKTPQL